MSYGKLRLSWSKIPLPAYKARSKSWLHKHKRDDYVMDPSVMHPIYNRLPEKWRKEYEKEPPIIHQDLEEPTASERPQMKGLWKQEKEEFTKYSSYHEKPPIPVRDYPIWVDYDTPMCKWGLWGGEGIVRGRNYGAGRFPLRNVPFQGHWKNYILQRSLYSEILDRSIDTTVTPRTLDLIDAAYGFDFYILKTPINELCSQLGSDLKREMLLKLARGEVWAHNPEKKSEIMERYAEFIIPEEDAEWVGLPLKDAMWKQWTMEKEAAKHDPEPLLEVYKRQLLKQLESDKNIEDSDVVVMT